ncbi:MAG: hypothetical protein WBA57_17890 [Elainellaceae cyanobacterium]
MPSSGRYQSRVLSFLSQQSMQWRDRAAKAARQTRLAVTWGTQMALYPIYVLFQSTRLAGYQLRQAVTRLMPLLAAVKDEDFDPQVGAPPVNSDDLIHNTLAYLETLDLPVILSSRALPQENVRSLPGAEQKRLESAEGFRLEGWIYPAVPLQFDADLQRSLSLEFLSNSNTSGSNAPLKKLEQKRLSGDSSEETSDQPTEDSPLSNSLQVNPNANSLARTAGVAIALSPQWQLVVSPSVVIDSPNPPSDPLVGDLAVMGFAELVPLPQREKQWALQRAIARLRQAVVPVHDTAAGTVNVTQMVRGVACLLATQSIVLVNHQNQVLDILTPLQQLQLHQRIVFETATYYRRHRLQLGAQQAEARARALSGKWTWRFLPPSRPSRSQKRKILPPVRAFQVLMGWVQQSPVAIATNLFQESALIALPRDSAAIASGTLQRSRRVTASLPPSSAPPKSLRPAPASPSPQRPFWQGLFDFLGVSNSSGSAPTSSSQGAIVYSGSGPTAPVAPQRWFDPDSQGNTQGWVNANDLSQARQAEAAPAIPSLPRRSRWMPDWASSFFNPGDSLDMDLADAEDVPTGAIAPSSPSGLSDNLRLLDPNNDVLNPDWPSTAAVAENQWNTRALSQGSLSASRNQQNSDQKGALAIDEEEADALVPTIVEAPATLVGYIKHPLEQILEWIDFGMFWLENTAERIWSWLTRSD